MRACRILILFAVMPLPGLAAPPKNVGAMSGYSREVFEDSMRMADRQQDAATHFLWHPAADDARTNPRSLMVRETSWYALGLLMRDGVGDRAKAAVCLDAVLKQQYLEAGTRWYGTFRRSPNEPAPPANARDFDQYDPNWREFVGNPFQMILVEYPDRIPAGMAERLYRAIDAAVLGEEMEGRLHPDYTNPSLMYGALRDFAAAHHHDAAEQAKADAWNESVYRLFKLHDAFNEYNSPTYYGVDVFGLALWRTYGSTARMRAMGSEMEAKLWSDVAEFYQPAMRNIAGPYDRSYGMDMTLYTTPIGVWMRTILPAGRAPLPVIEVATDHVADAWFAPMVVLLGARIPAAAQAKMERFVGPHAVRRQITDDRVATAWVGENVLFGAEATKLSVGVGPKSQFHPATMQWKTPGGAIGWAFVTACPKIDAVASEHGISIQTDGDVTLRVHAVGMKAGDVGGAVWRLPGLVVRVSTDAGKPVIVEHAEYVEITYPGVHTLVLEVTP